MKYNRHYFYPAAILVIGLITSQIFFSFVVYFSNLSLYSHLSAIKDAGYLMVPNQYIVSALRDLPPAFFGGLFFSLTTGSGITWVTFILMMAWIGFSCRKIFLVPIFAVWWATIFFTNINGANLQASSALIIIPIIVASAVLIIFDKKDARSFWKTILMHLIALIFICLSWVPHLKTDTFVSIRDYLLLGNSLGREINDFYYTYTMYPAEVFKSVDQKVLKTCKLKIGDPQVLEVVENKLRDLDYLSINRDISSNVTILFAKPLLIFLHDQTKIMESPLPDFLSNPDKTMSDFSDRVDVNSFFRKITFLSLLIGLPITIYILIHSAAKISLFFVPSEIWRFRLSTLVCLVIGVSATVPLYYTVSKPLPQAELTEQLRSKDWQIRTAALKQIADKEMKIDSFIANLDDTHFDHIPDKYWFAKALTQSRNENTIPILHKYLKDPNPNVVCMALYSLGKRNHRASTDKIIELILSSRHWYVQWYAYKALRRMGWTQPKHH